MGQQKTQRQGVENKSGRAPAQRRVACAGGKHKENSKCRLCMEVRRRTLLAVAG